MTAQGSRIALVTGANRGLGLEATRQLAEQGMTVYLAARTLENAQTATQPLLDAGFRVIPWVLDVTQTADIAQTVTHLQHNHGRLDVLINNAGILYDTWQTVTTANFSEVQAAFDTNTLGPWRLSQALIPLLKQSPQGRIVNVSSGAGSWSNMTGSTPAYSLSKLALNALTCMLATELRPTAILVNAVCPGWVATEMGGSGGRPLPEGAAGIVWAALLPPGGPSGGFFRDGKPIPW